MGRSLSENHGDYEYEVYEGSDGLVRGRKRLLKASADTARWERVPAEDLPSESLKDAFANYVGKSRGELGLPMPRVRNLAAG